MNDVNLLDLFPNARHAVAFCVFFCDAETWGELRRLARDAGTDKALECVRGTIADEIGDAAASISAPRLRLALLECSTRTFAATSPAGWASNDEHPAAPRP